MKRFAHIILLLALAVGATAQTLSCVSMEFDGHACCRPGAMSRVAKKVRLAAKQTPKSAEVPPCCLTPTPPASQQQQPAGQRDNRSPQATALNAADLTVPMFFQSAEAKPPRQRQLPGASPPPFILHHALLI